MEQLSTFLFLLGQASWHGIGVAAAGLTVLVVFLIGGKRAARLLLLPVIWCVPLVFAGLSVEPGHTVKTAQWTGYVATGSIVAFLVAAVWCLVTLRRSWLSVAGCIALNIPFAFMSAFVVGMASTGLWL